MVFSLLNDKYNINSYNIKFYNVEHYIKYILILLENFVGIIDYKHCPIISAKYHSSNTNYVHTMSLADIVSHPTKVIWPTAFFSNSKCLFVQHLCWPPAG